MKRKITLFLAILPILIALTACSAKTDAKPKKTDLNQKVSALVKKTKSNMVLIKGGCYMMGYKTDDMAAAVIKPHKVCLSDFYMSKYNVSYGDYDTYTEATGKPLVSKEYIHDGKPVFFRDASHPVDGLTWYQANDYVKWLRKKTGINYSLPTEAQWEYAARNRGKKGWDFATDNGKQEIGKNFPSRKMEANQKGARPGGGGGIPMPIGSLPVNPLGLCGMNGQVNQWVKDWYSPSYYSRSPVDNPQGPKTGTLKVMRGQGAGGSPRLSNNYGRYGISPNDANGGFRLVINFPEKIRE